MGITAAIVGGVGAAAAAASAANSIYQSSQKPKGGGGGGGVAGNNLNMASDFANWLFGPMTGGSKDQNQAALWGYQSKGSNFMSNPLLASIPGYLDEYLNRNQGAQTAQSMLAGAPAAYNEVYDALGRKIFPSITEAAMTGLPTSLDPIIKQRKESFFGDLIPQLKEQYAGQTGTYATDFLNNMNLEGRRLETELGALQVGLDEAAAGRRIQAAPLATNIGLAYSGLPAASANDYFAAAQSFHPASRALDVLSRLGAMSGQGQYIQPGYNPYGSSTGQLMSSIGSSIPSIATGITDLYKGFNSGGGSEIPGITDVNYG